MYEFSVDELKEFKELHGNFWDTCTYNNITTKRKAA